MAQLFAVVDPRSSPARSRIASRADAERQDQQLGAEACGQLIDAAAGERTGDIEEGHYFA